ncbi:hypothetical protein [Lederbergia ruris]|uniref:hypothetical protein n=1 Tax=Lederbergia ruris TaxID=217495 RepID=UPI0039A28BA0
MKINDEGYGIVLSTHMNIADELSHLCALLSQSIRKKKPPIAEWRASYNKDGPLTLEYNTILTTASAACP